MEIISFNLNGIRSAIKKGMAEWLNSANPDILCVQETKAQPQQIDIDLFEKFGYKSYIFSAHKKGYSGVALFSKQKPDNVIKGIGIKKFDDEGRYLRADYGDISIINTYFPSGSNKERQAIKMEWLNVFRAHINELRKIRKKLIISGDFNICRLWIDIHNPEKQQNTSGFLPEERQWFDNFIKDGFTDSFREFNKKPDNYSWWSYRTAARKRNKGWRIDYNIVSDNLRKNLEYADILKNVVLSDHCPVSVKIKV